MNEERKYPDAHTYGRGLWELTHPTLWRPY